MDEQWRAGMLQAWEDLAAQPWARPFWWLRWPTWDDGDE